MHDEDMDLSLDAQKKERNLMRAIFDRLENSYNQGYQRITIALAVANAALGLILLAPNPGSLEDLIKSQAQRHWVLWALCILGASIGILLILSTSQLRSPLSIEGFDALAADDEGRRDYQKWERMAYAAAAHQCERMIGVRKVWYIIAVALTVAGVVMYVIARCN